MAVHGSYLARDKYSGFRDIGEEMKGKRDG
jgi:hypothetical protein